MKLKNKKILITGIDGFIGTSLEAQFKKEGAIVFGISRKPKRNNIFNADIKDYDALDALFKKLNIQICIHLAGISLVEKGRDNPYETFTTNILGSINVLELTRVNKLERLIIASTSHVYGNNTPPFKEEFFPRPSRPYETSKASVDLIAQSYADSFSIPVLIPRFTNIYGPGDMHLNRLIPKTINSVINSEDVKLWGGNIIRDYLYIDDAVDAYIKLAKTDMNELKMNRIFNFGASERYSVSQIVEKIIKLSGKNIKIIKTAQDRANEVNEQYVSFLKARKLLNWEPKVDIDTGLSKSYKWYLEKLG